MKKILGNIILLLFVQIILMFKIDSAAALSINADSFLSPSIELSTLAFKPYLHAYELVANLSEYRILEGNSGNFDLKIYEVIGNSQVTHLATFNKTKIFLVGDKNQKYLLKDKKAYIDFKNMSIFVARGAHLTDPYIVHKEYRALRAFTSFVRKKNSKGLLNWINRNPALAQSHMNKRIRYIEEQHKKEPIFEKRISAKVNKVRDKQTAKFVFNFLGRRFSFYPGKDGYYYQDLNEGKILIRGYFHKIDILRYASEQRLELIGTIHFPEGKMIYRNGMIYPDDKYYVEIGEFIPELFRIKNIFSNKLVHNKGGIFYLDAGKIRWRFSLKPKSPLYYYLNTQEVFMSRDMKGGDIEVFIKTDKGGKAVLATIRVDTLGYVLNRADKIYLQNGKKMSLFVKRGKVLNVQVENIMRLTAQFFLLEAMRSDDPIACIKRYVEDGKLKDSDITSFIFSKKFDYLKPKNLRNASTFFIEAFNTGCFLTWVMPDFLTLSTEEILILKVAKKNNEYTLEKVFQLLKQQGSEITLMRFSGLLRSLHIKCQLENFEGAISADAYTELEILAVLFSRFRQDYSDIRQTAQKSYPEERGENMMDWFGDGDNDELEINEEKFGFKIRENKNPKKRNENKVIPNSKALIDMVKKSYEKQGLSLAEWARKNGLSDVGLSNILDGKNESMKTLTAQKIAGGLGMKVKDFNEFLIHTRAFEQSI